MALIVAAVLSPLATPPASANAVIMVTNAGDSGAGTLRRAIAVANSRPGPDRIEFNLPGAAPHVIAAQSFFPPITETLVIDGTTQPGFSTATRKPVVVLDGSSGIGSALILDGVAAGGSQIRGLEIVSWPLDAIVISNVPDVVIAGNFIGTDGAAALGNGGGLFSQSGAIAASGESRNLRIGGTARADRNVISGNHSGQIHLGATVGTSILGNYVGVNAAGTAAVAPLGHGIVAEASQGVTIGGTTTGARNVVSGNFFGIVLSGSSFTVLGNRIGTNAAGTAAIPNGKGITGGGADSVIGGTTAAARNLVSGNEIGIDLTSAGGTRVLGNWIGTNAAGTGAVANDVGVSIGNCCFSTDDNRIGGTAPGAGNVISGNRIGLQIAPGNANGNETGNDNVVQGNRIGTGPDGKTPIPNTEAGVVIQHTGGGAATGNQIGGLVPAAANVIAFNGGPGVWLDGDASVSHNPVRGNSIHDNGGLGIDLGPTGVAAIDDDDVDTGPNGLQNFPDVSSATSGPSGTTIAGTLESRPIDEFRVDFYASDGEDPSGNGEGARYLGNVFVITDGAGAASFGVTFPGVMGNFVTATATSGAGDTSEFSVAQPILGPGGFRFSSATYSVGEGAGTATITVQRVGGSDGAASVRFATGDGSARAPGDYTATSGRLRFADGQITRTFTVPIVNDTRHEPAESFLVTLSDPREGAALGTPTQAKVTIRASD